MEYYVLGPDGARFGPATKELLLEWAAQGRLTPASLVETEDGASVLAGPLLYGAVPPAPGVANFDPTKRLGQGAAYYPRGEAGPIARPTGKKLPALGLGWTMAVITLVAGWTVIYAVCGVAGLVIGAQALRENRRHGLIVLWANGIALGVSAVILILVTLANR